MHFASQDYISNDEIDKKRPKTVGKGISLSGLKTQRKK